MMECYGDWRTTGVMSALIAVITPALLRMKPARSFQPASSGSASFYLALYPAHELMNVYQTNCILFAQTAPWSLATTTSNLIESVDRLNYAEYANLYR